MADADTNPNDPTRSSSVEVVPGGAVRGLVRPPGSKSLTNRALICAALARGRSVLTGALRQLFALSEAYPDLKANQNFLALQEELTATEGRVAYSRQFYNDSVLDYNTKIGQFPTLIFARMLHFERREYFEADEAARSAPTIEL